MALSGEQGLQELEEMNLSFEVDHWELGQMRTDEIIPGGASLKVTRENYNQYIHSFANYKLNIEMKDQCRAFRNGFKQLVPVEWMRMFGSRELQLVISGDNQGIDMEDLKRNVNYASGYHESQPYIRAFWEIVASLSKEEQGNFLKFITSCSRPPLLGFASIYPKICIQNIPQFTEGGGVPRLPSAATCMNLLKLPKYDDTATLREKLLYAISANCGFELS